MKPSAFVLTYRRGRRCRVTVTLARSRAGGEPRPRVVPKRCARPRG
jgi:hypothetical protein